MALRSYTLSSKRWSGPVILSSMLLSFLGQQRRRRRLQIFKRGWRGVTAGVRRIRRKPPGPFGRPPPVDRALTIRPQGGCEIFLAHPLKRKAPFLVFLCRG